MHNIINDCVKYATDNVSDKKIAEGLSTYTKSLAVFKCGFCSGVGHTARNCASKKNIDVFTRSNPSFKVVWGSLKSKKKHEGEVLRAQVTKTKLAAIATAIITKQKVDSNMEESALAGGAGSDNQIKQGVGAGGGGGSGPG